MSDFFFLQKMNLFLFNNYNKKKERFSEERKERGFIEGDNIFSLKIKRHADTPEEGKKI